MNGKLGNSDQTNDTRRAVLPVLSVGAVTFVLGAAVAVGYVQWSAQQQQLAMLTQMVTDMQAAPNIASRNATTDLLSVTQDDDAPTQTAFVVETSTTQVATIAPPAIPAPGTTAQTDATTGATPDADDGSSTVDRLRDLVAASGGSADMTDQERRALRIETLAVIDAGVQELAAAVVAGDYDIHTNYKDDGFSGRIHFAFIGHEADQTALESYVAAAANSGLIAHGPSVVGSDGAISGHIMLFDLVERSMENGTAEEQRAVQALREKAVALLAAEVVVGEAPNAAGERFYVVESGDSLAYIALQFYGNTNDYVRIFDANRAVLRNPERIDVGQRLLIPQA